MPPKSAGLHPAILLQIQFFSNAPQKITKGGPSAWESATYVGDPDEVSDSWSGPVLDVTAIWGVN